MNSTVVSFIVGSFFFSCVSWAAPANYKVSMRVGLKGQSPISINTIAKSGKKSYVSQFSDDGQTETLVTVFAKKSQVMKQDGLLMNVSVTKRVRGEMKIQEKAQMFAPENKETEFGTNSRGKISGNLSLAVMTHRL
ncbi:MAG: hypothetical protein HUU57_07215 [Bdellovibrio sp.]|nr:hypothetical protein [Bdellovibrio sp.]